MGNPTKERIVIIDALRGFALMGILLLHSMEHFELYRYPETGSAVLGWLDDIIEKIVWFIFAGKSYAIFSLLFGLSFYIQMKNQEERGYDFRARFALRLFWLFIFGYVNGMMYQGEIFVCYAVLGLLLIPLYKVPDKWIKVICAVCLLQLPNLICFFIMLTDPGFTFYPFAGLRSILVPMYGASYDIYESGSLCDVLSYNAWSGQIQKWLWMIWSSRTLQIIGLFTLGMLIGRKGIHKDPEKMIKYSTKGMGVGLVLFSLFYCLENLSPIIGTQAEIGVELGTLVFKYYWHLGMMLIIIGLFVLSYFKLGAKTALDNLAPVGRMSLTNYMVQSLLGILIFFGFGLGLAMKAGFTYSFLIGIALCTIQIICSKIWLTNFYYGPVEWLWRGLTWMSFKNLPLKRR